MIRQVKVQIDTIQTYRCVFLNTFSIIFHKYIGGRWHSKPEVCSLRLLFLLVRDVHITLAFLTVVLCLATWKFLKVTV